MVAYLRLIHDVSKRELSTIGQIYPPKPLACSSFTKTPHVVPSTMHNYNNL